MIVKFAILILLPFSLFAQEEPDPFSILYGDTLMPAPVEEIPAAEELLDQIESETDHVELLDRLIWLESHPYDLNTIRRDELESLPGVTPGYADDILVLRQSLKRFTSVDQLLLISGSGEVILRMINPYVAVTIPEESVPPKVTLRSRVTGDIQQRRGFEQGRFLGSPLKVYNRLALTSTEFELGALFEKDAGERTPDGFVSGFVRVRDLSFITDAIVGDYTVEAGQGLVLWRGTAFGKGSEAVSVARKSSLGPQPYRSSNEFNLLRGAAVTSNIITSIGEVKVSVFFSRRALSATTIDGETVSGFAKDGYFRTETELAKRNALIERLAGSTIRLQSADGDFHFGLSAYRSTFNKEVVPADVSSFAGKDKAVAGMDASGRIGKLSLFGEIARTDEGSGAGMGGALLQFSPRGSIVAVYRNYSPRYRNLHANGFGERSETNNERGMYFGIQMPLTHKLRVSGYVDYFKFPMRSFSAPLPLSGHEVLLQMESSMVHRLDLTLRYATKRVETNESAANSTALESKRTLERSQQKARLTAIYSISSKTKLKGRVEIARVRYSSLKEEERGILLYQEVQTRPTNDLKLEARLIFFDTDSYDSRLYEYENDLRGVFSNPALYGKGRRWYLLVGWNVGGLVLVSAKYSETLREGVTSISSGPTGIVGDLDNRVSMQVEVSL